MLSIRGEPINYYNATLDKKVLSEFLKPISAISKSDDTVQLEFVKEGIQVCKFSTDHVAVLTSTLFDDNASEGLKARLSLKRLTDAVNACGETVMLKVSDTAVVVGDKWYTRTIRCDMADDNERKLPQIEGEPINLTEVGPRVQSAVLGSVVSFAWGKEGVEIGSADETGEAWLTILKDMDTEGEATFPSEYAVGMLKAIPKDAKVTAYLTDSAPIKIDYMNANCKGSILIAPRISREDE